MKWADMVEQAGSDKFGSLFKTARDHAALLDGDVLRIEAGDERAGTLARTRQDLFEEFCAICVQAGLEAPELERDTVVAQIAAKVDEKLGAEADGIAAFVSGQLASAGGEVAEAASRDIEALAKVVQMMPEVLQQFGSVRNVLLALLNSKLMAAGLRPLRPDHATLKFGDASGRAVEPPRPLKVLIVDDTPEEIVRTFRAVAGRTGLTIDAIQVFGDFSGDREEALQAAAQLVVERGPDIVLMDQGMGSIKGSDLVRAVRGLEAGAGVVFVGNTGGSPDELEEAGAIGNMDKGRNIRPLETAITRCGK